MSPAPLFLVLSLMPGAEPTPGETFEKRLLPIFKSPNPSSCVQCHLAGVDLKDYILPDHEKTFRSLRDQGLIDVKAPEKSRILALIQMGAAYKGGAALIHAKARKAEQEAFAAWIKACCADEALVKSPPLDAKERSGPTKPAAVIRHARKDRMLESFERNVWSVRFRCMNCHTEGTPQADKHVKEHGPRVAWFKKAGPEATMDYLLGSRLIDLDAPEKSLLLRKPLGQVKHGGGIKLLVGDGGYKSIRSWIEDVAAIKAGKYAKASDLPAAAPMRVGTELWLKLTNTPAAWGDKLLIVTVSRYNAETRAWEAVATSDRKVWGGGKLWQHTLTLQARPGSKQADELRKGRATLPPGRYRVEVYVDAKGRLADDWKATLGATDYAGAAVFEVSAWRPGYGAMTTVDAAKVKR